MSDSSTPVQCNAHGETPATFLCAHLCSGVALGFHASADDPDDRWPDAWCDGCEAIQQRDGEWNDENQPAIRLLCTGCYEGARARNIAVPAPIAPGRLEVAWEALVHASCERAQARQERAKERWGLHRKRWAYDHVTNTIRFYDDGHGPTVVADVIITGSFSTATKSWMWAWANEDYPVKERLAVQPVRIFGEVRNLPKLAEAYWPAEEVDASEVTQVAAELLGADAIYRMPDEHLRVFMLLRDLRVEG